MKIDEFSNGFQFSERHHCQVNRPAASVYQAIQQVRSTDIRLFWPMMKLRGIFSEAKRQSFNEPIIKEAQRVGFYLLHQQNNQEVLLGLIGQFWKLRSSPPIPISDPTMFNEFQHPDYAKATLNFFIHPLSDNKVRLSTETRIQLSSKEAHKKFSVYWYCIRLGSGLIRRQWLAAIKRKALQIN